MKKLLSIFIPAMVFSQVPEYKGRVGINTTTPTAILDVKGDLRVQDVPNGLPTDSVLVIRDGWVKKISLGAITNPFKCPNLVKDKSDPYYLLFKSLSSIPNPNNSLVIETINFKSAGTWTKDNYYFFSYTNTTGRPLNINRFTVYFGNNKCVYN